MVLVEKLEGLSFSGTFYWNLIRVKPQAKLWRLTTWIPWDTQLRHTPDTVRAYLEYKLNKNERAARAILETVIRDDPGNLLALQTLLMMHSEKEDHKNSELVHRIIKSRTNKTSHRQAKYEEASSYLMMGSKYFHLAQIILEELNQENPHNTEILLALISSMIKQINRQRASKPPGEAEFLCHIVSRINRALEILPQESRVYTLVLQMTVAANTSSVGRQWIRALWKNHPGLKPSECVQLGLKHRHGDSRDISLYSSVINYYDSYYERDEAYHMTLEALTFFPEEKYFLLRQTCHLIEKAMDNFKTRRTVKQEDVLKMETMLTTLGQATWWEYRYKVAMHLGTASYLKGDLVKAYDFYKQSLTLFMDEYGDSAEILQIHFSWCFVVVLRNESGTDPMSLFPHMRAALRINEQVVKETALKSLLLIFNKALQENPGSTFYKLCNGYLQLEFGKLQQAEQYFLDAICDRKNEHTLLALGEQKAASGEVHSAKQQMLEAKQFLSEDPGNALRDQLKILENKLRQDETRIRRSERLLSAEGRETINRKRSSRAGRGAPVRTEYSMSCSSTGPLSPTLWICCTNTGAAGVLEVEHTLCKRAKLRQATLNRLADGDTVAVSESTRVHANCIQNKCERTPHVTCSLTNLVTRADEPISEKYLAHASQKRQIVSYEWKYSCVTHNHFIIYSWQARYLLTYSLIILKEAFSNWLRLVILRGNQ